MRAYLPLLAALLATVGCSNSTPSGSVGMSANPQCGDQAQLNGDGTATALSCAFEQQVSNIQRNGYALSGTLVDAAGTQAAQMTMGCGSYMMGTDPSGTTVIVNAEPSDSHYGEVRSHGAFHAGYATTTLPAQLKTPLHLDTH
jgi:hypothetical protein